MPAMAINPIIFTERVVGSFLRYQLTAHLFADEHMHQRMRTLVWARRRAAVA